METTVAIQNLKCGGCGSTITKKMNALNGIEIISLNIEGSTVSFSYETDDDLKMVQKELLKLGYPMVGTENKLGTKAKSYISCAIGKLNTI